MTINLLLCLLPFFFGFSFQQTPHADLADTYVTISDGAVMETLLTSVKCLPSGATTSCICNIISSAPPFSPFDVWRSKTGTQTEFEVHYVGQRGHYFVNYTVASTYRLEVVCSENNVDSSPVFLEVDVWPNHHPVVTNWPSDVAVVGRGQPTGTLVYSVVATDVENEPLTYSMTQFPPDNYLRITSSGGIELAVHSSSVAVDRVVCKVDVSDVSNTVSLTVFVDFSNRNHQPIINNLPKNVSIFENTTGGFLLTALDVIDPDNDPVTTDCHVVYPAAENYKFYFDIRSREIKVSQLPRAQSLFDFDDGVRQYVIHCVASDGYLTSAVGVVIIDIENVHEPPIFSHDVYYCTLDESWAKMSHCDPGINVTAPDSRRGVTYAFKSSASRLESFFWFNVTTGHVTFATDYDVDEGVRPVAANLTIIATDDIGMTSEAKIEISIRDVNDNTCKFRNNSLLTQFNSSTPLGVIDVLHADDKDLTSPNNDVVYETSAGDTSYLRIMPDGGVLYSQAVSPSHEEQIFYLTVRCVDGGHFPRSSTAVFAAHFLPVPDSLWDNPVFLAVFSVLMAIVSLCLLFLFYKCCLRSKAPGEPLPKTPAARCAAPKNLTVCPTTRLLTQRKQKKKRIWRFLSKKNYQQTKTTRTSPGPNPTGKKLEPPLNRRNLPHLSRQAEMTMKTPTDVRQCYYSRHRNMSVH
ncbi:protocadherin-9-like isoform X2 [Pomacea canaliculata]|uniref:protocadherin-9-like isoform X2 n=1 Tax=Pomacea canaliculata TaxID=400727 RepID=UPI000D72DC70|nr:protocadherin-9-like isoform X2 [Pomacea canaliculata]